MKMLNLTLLKVQSMKTRFTLIDKITFQISKEAAGELVMRD